MVDSKQPPRAPVEHFDSKEHRRQLAYRANACIAPVLTSLTAGQRIMWDGEAWVNDGEEANACIAPVLTSLTAGQRIMWDGEAWVNDGEEGVFTPTYATTGTAFSSVTYARQIGVYVLVGDLVWVAIDIQTSAITVGSASGRISVSGLPFPVVGDTPGGLTIPFVDAFVSGGHPSAALLQGSGAAMRLRKRATADGPTINVAVADMATGAASNWLIMSGWYKTS